MTPNLGHGLNVEFWSAAKGAAPKPSFVRVLASAYATFTHPTTTIVFTLSHSVTVGDTVVLFCSSFQHHLLRVSAVTQTFTLHQALNTTTIPALALYHPTKTAPLSAGQTVTVRFTGSPSDALGVVLEFAGITGLDDFVLGGITSSSSVAIDTHYPRDLVVSFAQAQGQTNVPTTLAPLAPFTEIARVTEPIPVSPLSLVVAMTTPLTPWTWTVVTATWNLATTALSAAAFTS